MSRTLSKTLARMRVLTGGDGSPGGVVAGALDVAPPVTEWGAEEVAIDFWHHLVYAGATSLAYATLDRDRR